MELIYENLVGTNEESAAQLSQKGIGTLSELWRIFMQILEECHHQLSAVETDRKALSMQESEYSSPQAYFSERESNSSPTQLLEALSDKEALREWNRAMVNLTRIQNEYLKRNGSEEAVYQYRNQAKTILDLGVNAIEQTKKSLAELQQRKPDILEGIQGRCESLKRFEQIYEMHLPSEQGSNYLFRHHLFTTLLESNSFQLPDTKRSPPVGVTNPHKVLAGLFVTLSEKTEANELYLSLARVHYKESPF